MRSRPNPTRVVLSFPVMSSTTNLRCWANELLRYAQSARRAGETPTQLRQRRRTIADIASHWRVSPQAVYNVLSEDKRTPSPRPMMRSTPSRPRLRVDATEMAVNAETVDVAHQILNLAGNGTATLRENLLRVWENEPPTSAT